MKWISLALLLAIEFASGFSLLAPPQLGLPPRCQSRLFSSSEAMGEQSELESLLAVNYPSFYKLVIKPNEKVIKELRKSSDYGFTLFAPNEAAFEKLGQKKINQLEDIRNLETTSKIGEYHTIGDETVSLDILIGDTIGGVLTMGGEVRVGPSQTGGLFGMGGKKDGSAVIGSNARIIQSFPIRAGVVHEVDSLVSPEILWRYVDQLRIPGSK